MPQLRLELPGDLHAQLCALAEETGCDARELLLEALEHYLTVKQWQKNELELALQEADAGGFASEEEVRQVLERYPS